MSEQLLPTRSKTRARIGFAAAVACVIAPIVLIALGAAGCSNSSGFPNPKSTTASGQLSVTPASITVAAGSVTPFMAVFNPAAPTGGSLTWSVTPVIAGTINSAGVFTASNTAGQYTVLATWTPASLAAATILRGSATVGILAVPQLNGEISPDLVQASGAIQTNGAIQNWMIVGQEVPSVISVDSKGKIQVRSGFTPPMACPGTNTVCQ
jgi:hypothetical protein